MDNSFFGFRGYFCVFVGLGEETETAATGISSAMSDRLGDQEAAADEMAKLLALRKQEEEAAANTDEKSIFRFDDGDSVDLRLPPDTSFAHSLEADADGYKPITWTQLKKKFWYERTAHKFKLTGDISQREQQYWDRAKQIKVRDKDGVEGALFFYDEHPEPHFSFDDLRVGNVLTIRSPRFHRFMDSQEGMRVEEAKSITGVAKRTFTDEMRMDYGVLCKSNGTSFFNKKKYEDAVNAYAQAIQHLEGTFHERPEHEQRAKELVAQCLLNIAACRIAEGKWPEVEDVCEKALIINASPALNAKAFFRMGQACLEMDEVTAAREKLQRALELAPGDSRITQELDRLNKLVSDQRSAQSALFSGIKSRIARPAGMLDSFGFKVTPFSKLNASLDSISNFRDVGGILAGGAIQKKVRPFLFYRSSSLFDASPEDVSKIQHELGVKTILDLRYEGEANLACKTAQDRAERHLKRYLAAFPIHGDSDDGDRKKEDDRPPPPPAFVDYRNYFHPVVFKPTSFRHDGTLQVHKTTLKKLKLQDASAVLASQRVSVSIDLGARAVIAATAYWVLLVAAILTAIFQFSRAARLVVTRTVQQIGALKLYQSIIDKQLLEIRKVLDIVSKPENYPLVVCCSLGKDRTGIIAMLVLSILGVSDDAIADDFARTTAQMTPRMKKMQHTMGLGEEWNEAKRETMLELISYIRSKYVSVELYLTQKVNVPPEQLESIRRILLG